MNKQELNKHIQGNQCVIIGSNWCGYTQRALQNLKNYKIKHKYIDADKNPTILKEINKEKRPQIWINQKYIGGNDKLEEYFSKQKSSSTALQTGGGKHFQQSKQVQCSTCGSKNTNKSTCPYNPNTNKVDLQKHERLI